MDGEWLAYAIPGEGIFVSSKEGTNNRLVVEHSSALHPVWSPDGEWLAYHHVNVSGGPSVISKVRLDSGEIIELFEGGLYPSWRWSNSD
jgi:Tol biopolymer transport system component